MIFGLQQIEILTEKINAIEFKTGLILGEIHVWDGSSKMVIKNIQKASVKPFAESINKAIDLYRNRAQSGSNTQRSNYYKNSKHHINLNAETLELEARKAVINVIKNTPRLQTALVERAKASKSAAVQLQGQVETLKTKIEQLEAERTRLDSRLDALIAVSNEAEIKMFKDEYVHTASKIKADIELCRQQIADIEKSKTESQNLDVPLHLEKNRFI